MLKKWHYMSQSLEVFTVEGGYLWRWLGCCQRWGSGCAELSSSLGMLSSPSASWEHNGVTSCGQWCSEKQAVGLDKALCRRPHFWLPGPFLRASSKAKVGFYCWSLAAALAFPAATFWGDRWLVLAGAVLFLACERSDLSCRGVCV